MADEIALIVQMNADYTTESHNLGKRTFRAGCCYQVCPVMFQELMETGLAVKLDPRRAPRSSAIEREQVSIIPRVTRWFTANGADTHFLTIGKEQRVPSNLAAFLTLNGYAEAA